MTSLFDGLDTEEIAREWQRDCTPQRSIYLDIETVPDDSRLASFGLDPIPPMPEFLADDKLPGIEQFLAQDLKAISKWLAANNPPVAWCCQVQAAESVAEKPRKGVADAMQSYAARLESAANAQQERCKLLSVTPEFCRIVAMGICPAGSDEIDAWVIGDTLRWAGREVTEAHLLKHFWYTVRTGHPVCGYNVAGFDLPTIFIRSALLGIEPTRCFDLRPWGKDVVDLMTSRYPKGPAKRLKDLARFYGIGIDAQDVDGSQVAELFAAGKIDEIRRYVSSDVAVSRQIHRFYSGYFCK